MTGSVEEQHAENKVKDDQENQDSIHHKVHTDIGFILPVKLFQSFEHRVQVYRKVSNFCQGLPAILIVNAANACNTDEFLNLYFPLFVTSLQNMIAEPCINKLFLRIGVCTLVGCPGAYDDDKRTL